MSKSSAKKRAWFIERCEKGCQICGVKFPGRKNFGLRQATIIEDGPHMEHNYLALCPNCETSFDKILKQAIHKAVTKYNEGIIPKNWENLGDPI